MTLAEECPSKLPEEAHKVRKHVVSVRTGSVICLSLEAAQPLLDAGTFRVTKAQAAADRPAAPVVPESPPEVPFVPLAANALGEGPKRKPSR